MKSSLLLVVGSLAAWMAFTPATCRAQAEIAPDHFGATNVELFGQPFNTISQNRTLNQKQAGNEDKVRISHTPATVTTPENTGLKVVQIRFDFLDLPMSVVSRKIAELAQWRTRVRDILRMWHSGLARASFVRA